MQTRSSLQRRSNSESSDRVVAHIKPRPWGDEHHEQPQTVQPKNSGFDFKNADWFSHDPGPRSPVRVFNSIQAKLTVGAPNDVYEQEADRVAEQVMSTPGSANQQPIQREEILEEELQTKPLAATITPLVQREAILEEEKEEELQTKPLGNSIQREGMPEEGMPEGGMPEEEKEQEIQTKRSPDAGFQAGSNLENRLNSSQGGGIPLSEEVRSFMEPRFGADFSQVRVHTGNESVQMNQDLNAQAFTHKQDVYFGAGKAPANDALTAHELTHVVQQTGNIQKNTKTTSDFIVKAKAKQSSQRVTINRLEQTAGNSFSEVLQCQKAKKTLDKKASDIIARAKDTTQPIDKRAVQVVWDIVREYWDASKVKEIVYRENEAGLSATPIGKGNEIKGKIYVGEYFINSMDHFARRVLQVGHELQHVDQQRAGMGGEKNIHKREFLAYCWEALAEEKAGTGRMPRATRRLLIDGALGNFYCLSTDKQKEFSAKKDELLERRKEINKKAGNDPTEPPTACK